VNSIVSVQKTGHEETDKLLEQLAAVTEKTGKPLELKNESGKVEGAFFGLAGTCCS